MEHQHVMHNHSQHSMNSPMGNTSHYHHPVHAGMITDFRKRFYVTLIVTIPVMLLSPMIQQWFHFNLSFNGSTYLLFTLSSIVFFYGGLPFLKGIAGELKNKTPGMMTLIAVAITAAYTYSVATVFGLPGMDFFWELCTLILIMLLGHWIEMKSVAGASRELELLVQLMPSDAHKIMPARAGSDGAEMIHDIKTDSLRAGDLILIKPGEKVAADGIISEGESYLNESMLTGESVPAKKQKDDKVIAGSINGNGSLKVKVTHASKDSYLSRVIKLVDDAQKTKSKTQLFADKAARILTIVALLAGFATFFFWWLITKEPVVFALERMVTVIVICCPHALGLAVPLVVAISTSVSAKNGLLIKNRTAFENARKITTIIFDKTGTLTFGKFEVVRIVPLSFGEGLGVRSDEKEIIRLVSALEQNSEHPIATGIIAKANELSITIPSVNNFNAITGKELKLKLKEKILK
jgi:Cu2+-exporting ATPase